MELATVMDGRAGYRIHTIATAAHRRVVHLPQEEEEGIDGAKGDLTACVAPVEYELDEWHVRTVNEEWCGKGGAYRSQDEIDILLRDEGASAEEVKRLK